jgi:hypothetical protein
MHTFSLFTFQPSWRKINVTSLSKAPIVILLMIMIVSFCAEHTCDGNFMNPVVDQILTCTNITGNLQFTDTSDTSIVLPELSYIGGHLNINYDALITLISIPNLSFVAAFFEIFSNNKLKSMELNSLQYIGRYIYVDADNSLEYVSLDQLTYVGGDFWINDNNLLSFVSVASLTFVGGGEWSFYVDHNPALTLLTIPALQYVANGTFKICENAESFVIPSSIVPLLPGHTCMVSNGSTICPPYPGTPCDSLFNWIIKDMAILFTLPLT